MTIARVTEITASSAKSFDDAIREVLGSVRCSDTRIYVDWHDKD